MTLSEYLILPGVILDVDDPQKHGRIKCMIPGIFDPLSPLEALPWIYPFSMNKYQNFSKPIKGAKVWVLRNTTNEDEYRYINMFEYNDVTKELINSRYENDLEIIMSRKTLNGAAQIYYDDIDGIILKVNDNKLQICPNGNVKLGNGDTVLEFAGGHVSIGTGNQSFEPAVKGDSLKSLFNELQGYFDDIANACTGSETGLLKNFFIQIKDKLSDDKYLSQKVSIN